MTSWKVVADRENTSLGCADFLKSISHGAWVVFDEPGPASLVVRHRQPPDEIVDREYEILVEE